MTLGNKKERHESLKIHINHRDWRPTPYISFSSSPAAIEVLAKDRIGRGRGRQTLTVINPNIRIMRKLPILNYAKEMEYYGVRNPYGGDVYLQNHHLCLWQVTEDEVVEHWDWGELSQTKDWYKNIVLPAFDRHDLRCAVQNSRRIRRRTPVNVTKEDAMASLMSNLSREFCPQVDQIWLTKILSFNDCTALEP